MYYLYFWQRNRLWGRGVRIVRQATGAGACYVNILREKRDRTSTHLRSISNTKDCGITSQTLLFIVTKSAFSFGG